MNTQIFDGGQHNETLDMRTLVDWCLPPDLECEESITEIAKIYRKGEQFRKHRAPIFHDKQSRSNQKYVVSKVLDNQLI